MKRFLSAWLSGLNFGSNARDQGQGHNNDDARAQEGPTPATGQVNPQDNNQDGAMQSSGSNGTPPPGSPVAVRPSAAGDPQGGPVPGSTTLLPPTAGGGENFEDSSLPESQEAQLLSRWYQLVGEMQCLKTQMQSMGMQPPDFMPGAPAATAASPTTPQVPQHHDGTHKGQGTNTDPDGGKYEGPHLPVETHTYSDVGDYEGECKDGQRHGQGTFIFPSRESYVGAWKDDKMHGQGTYRWANGAVYDGEWEDDEHHGEGTYSFSDGGTYKGKWKGNKRHGQGTYYYPDGGTYKGKWEGNKRHGQGTYTDPDGEKYEGQWKDDKKDGEGAHTYSDAAIFKGEYKKGKWHGQGTYTSASGGMLSVVVQDCYFTTNDGGSVLASRVAFERALAHQQQSTKEAARLRAILLRVARLPAILLRAILLRVARLLAILLRAEPPSWGHGRGIAVIVADRLDGASRDEEYIKTIAQSMSCELKVLSNLHGDDTSPQGIRHFLGENAQWLEGGTYVGLWFSGHGDEMTVECQGGETLDISEFLSLVNRGPLSVNRPLLAFINACRGTHGRERVALAESAAPALIRQQNMYIAYPSPRGAVSFRTADDGSIWLEALADVAPHCADGKTTVTQLCSSARTHLDTLQDFWKNGCPSDETTLLDPWANAVFAPRIGAARSDDLSDDSQGDGDHPPTLAVGGRTLVMGFFATFTLGLFVFMCWMVTPDVQQAAMALDDGPEPEPHRSQQGDTTHI